VGGSCVSVNLVGFDWLQPQEVIRILVALFRSSDSTKNHSSHIKVGAARGLRFDSMAYLVLHTAHARYKMQGHTGAIVSLIVSTRTGS
jgi:hypothetical protein